LTNLFSFTGHPEQDHLRLLKTSTSNFLLGGRNAIYSLSAENLSISSTLNWTVSSSHREECQWKGQEDWKCHNFLTSFHGPFPSNGQYLICGTNAFKPMCRYYNLSDVSKSDRQLSNSKLSNTALSNLSGEYIEQFSGVGYSSFDPQSDHTSLFHGGEVWSATVADFGAADPLIYKKPMRTEKYYDRQLNSPEFVGSRSYGENAFFFFREQGLEFKNCADGPKTVSRVGRICGGDPGTKKHRDRFSTFLKARLNCSVPGKTPFLFDHLRKFCFRIIFFHAFLNKQCFSFNKARAMPYLH